MRATTAGEPPARSTCPSQLAVGPFTHADDLTAAFVVSTPGRPVGAFYRLFLDPRWTTMSISAAAVPRLREHYESERAEHGADDPFFRAQVWAEFADAQESESPGYSFGLSARASLAFVATTFSYASSTCCSAHSNLASLIWSWRSKS